MWNVDAPGVLRSKRLESMDGVRDAIRSLRPDWPEMADLFTDEDLCKLLSVGYSDLRTLRDATAQMLHTTGLRPARIDNITQGEPELNTSHYIGSVQLSCILLCIGRRPSS